MSSYKYSAIFALLLVGLALVLAQPNNEMDTVMDLIRDKRQWGFGGGHNFHHGHHDHHDNHHDFHHGGHHGGGHHNGWGK